MLLSSSTVYGDFEEDVVNESVRPKPIGIYANTKYMAERLVYLCKSIWIRHCNHKTICIIRREVSKECQRSRKCVVKKPLLLEGGGDGRLDFTTSMT